MQIEGDVRYELDIVGSGSGWQTAFIRDAATMGRGWARVG